MKSKILSLLFIALCAMSVNAQNNVIEEVAWVVGDEPIFKSDIEEQYMQMQYERVQMKGNPYCVIPERMAIEKLFLHQAKLDSITAQDAMVLQQVEARINFFISNLGSKEKVEEYFRKPIAEIREQQMTMVRDQYMIQEVQRNLTKNVKATPQDVRRYFNTLPEDSLPYVPLMVEAQIITLHPRVPQQEIEDIKARLRQYSQQVNSGEYEFSTLAILYSEDGSSVKGGEIGFMGRAELMTEYANAAFNLNDTKRVSKIVETEAGFHIIQLIEKRGDKVNTRHILLRPKVSDKDLSEAINKLDSLRNDLNAGKFKFEQAAQYVSQDVDSRNNRGMILNKRTRGTKFEMADLNPAVGKQVDKLQPGEISEPFVMMNEETGREVVAIVKLVRRIEGHKANLSEDFQTIKDLYEGHKRQQIITDWVKEKQKNTFVRIEEGWRDCEFEYDWLKK